MLYLGATPLSGQLKSKLFTSSGTFVVPSDVSLILVDGAGGGSGGGGGNATPGGGGGGGCCAFVVQQEPMPVTPGETLTVTIGAGGVGGAAGVDGGNGGKTKIVGYNTLYVSDDAIYSGKSGANPNGGNSGRSGWYFTEVAGGAGAGGAGSGNFFGPINALGAVAFPNYMMKHRYALPGAGGALNFNGGGSNAVLGQVDTVSGGTGGSSGGGGGGGGGTLYGRGGNGGSNGSPGANATGYGAGGGGGSGNSAGGNGSPGFVRLYMVTASTI